VPARNKWKILETYGTNWKEMEMIGIRWNKLELISNDLDG
jgi:hypothetical protein